MASLMDFDEGNDSGQCSISHRRDDDELIENPELSSFTPLIQSEYPTVCSPSKFEDIASVALTNELSLDCEPKLSVARQLFVDNKNKRALSVCEPIENKKQAVISFKGALTSYCPPLLCISQVADSKLRFAIEGKVLNKYGTYKSPKDFKKFLKVDLVDKEGLQTITLVVGDPYISKYKPKLEVGAFIRVEGSVVVLKNVVDGGTCTYSLNVDATTSIIKAEPFDVTLVFIPQISIQKFLAKSLIDPSLKATLAFVVLQVDTKKAGDFDQLTVADGSQIMDRATLSFITGRKALYNQLVAEFEGGNVVMYVARNIGIWRDKSNTLSIYDITILTPVYGDRLRRNLMDAFHCQIHEMGYGQEVVGTFTVSNFNDALTSKMCSLCKDSKVNQIPEGGYCFSCGKVIDIIEVPCIEGLVTQEHTGTVICVKLAAAIVDRVLKLEDTFIKLYRSNPIMLRVSLSEIEIFGKFFVDDKAVVVSFVPHLVV